MSEEQKTVLTGGCLCGAVRYEVHAGPMTTVHCYCSDCRRTSGTGHGTHVVVPKAAFSLTGELRHYETTADSGNVVSRHFCPTCGSAIYSSGSRKSDVVFLRASSLDDLDAVTPQASVYVGRAPKWDPVDAALPAFPGMPSQEQRQAMLRRG